MRNRGKDAGTPFPRSHELTILAQDPSVTDRSRRILRAKVRVPADRLEPGPRGSRFHVVDYDATRRRFHKPPDLPGDPGVAPGWTFRDRFARAPDKRLLEDPAFRAQNVYAIAARTLGAFESALGRPVPWAFGSHILYLVPTAFAEANAYYSDTDQALLFGYFPGRRRETIYTCLAHDIVAHETTHAILDGLRSRFDAPGLPDQPAFHEGFADIVALLSLFSIPEAVRSALGRQNERRIPEAAVGEEALRESVLVKLAEQMGDEVHASRGNGLRHSVALRPTTEWRDPRRPEWEEPHRRGEVLAAAVMQTLIGMWRSRLEALIQAKTLDRERAAEEGSMAARHLLQMLIRAIDYCPPTEFEFEDFLDAVLLCDAEVAPDDTYEYRTALAEAFRSFGIEKRQPLPPSPGFAVYPNIHHEALRADPDEVFRFIWDNAAYLGIDTRFYLHVEGVRPSVRIGPDGFVIRETVADYVQELTGTLSELEALSGRAMSPQTPIPGDAQIKMWGGGTIIFDQFGGVKYHPRKPLQDWDRQVRRLDYLSRRGLWDGRRRLGFSYGIPLGQRFALYHRPDRSRSAEEW